MHFSKTLPSIFSEILYAALAGSLRYLSKTFPNSIANDKESIRQVNVPNKGAIAGIPDDVAVEVPARVDGGGVHRIAGKSLPRRIMKYVIYPRMMRMEWALEAFLEGGRDLLFEWLITDPRTKSLQQIKEVIDALLSLPENEEMAKHFS